MKVFLITSLLMSSNVWAITTSDTQKVKDLITETILNKQTTENTGVAVSVFNRKEIVFQKGFGYSNQESKKAVTNHTAFAIGSTTKAFTALGLKLLENKNQLNLTDRVIDHLSDFRVANEFITKEATIEDLLSHRIGLPRHDLMWLLSDFSREENYKRIPYLAFPEKAEENFRKIFSYNNFLFMVAGKIIEKQSGLSFEEYTEKNILKPLQMNETFLNIPKDYEDLADPYFKEIKVEHRDISDVGPAGSIYSTSSDMTKWIQSLMNKKWENQDDLFIPRIAIDNQNPSLDYSYGLAWMINTMNKDYSWYFHDGAIDGFSTIVLFSKELDLGVVVLVNQNGSDLGGNVVSSLLKYEIAKRPINKSFSKNYLPSLRLEKTDSIPLFPATSSSSLEEKIENHKTYEHPGYGELSTFNKDGKFYAQYYKYRWELKNMEHEYFNYIIDLVLGADHYDFPFQITDESLKAPFQEDVPIIDFKIK